MNLNELYTQIITENSRSKENRHPVPGATHSLEGVNPSCGDDITLQLRVRNQKWICLESEFRHQALAEIRLKF